MVLSTDELEAMGYRELQALAKEHHIPANQKKAALVSALAAVVAAPEEAQATMVCEEVSALVAKPKTPVGNPARVSKSPKTKTPVAAKSPAAPKAKTPPPPLAPASAPAPVAKTPVAAPAPKVKTSTVAAVNPPPAVAAPKPDTPVAAAQKSKTPVAGAAKAKTPKTTSPAASQTPEAAPVPARRSSKRFATPKEEAEVEQVEVAVEEEAVAPVKEPTPKQRNPTPKRKATPKRSAVYHELMAEIDGRASDPIAMAFEAARLQQEKADAARSAKLQAAISTFKTTQAASEKAEQVRKITASQTFKKFDKAHQQQIAKKASIADHARKVVVKRKPEPSALPLAKKAKVGGIAKSAAPKTPPKAPELEPFTFAPPSAALFSPGAKQQVQNKFKAKQLRHKAMAGKQSTKQPSLNPLAAAPPTTTPFAAPAPAPFVFAPLDTAKVEPTPARRVSKRFAADAFSATKENVPKVQPSAEKPSSGTKPVAKKFDLKASLAKKPSWAVKKGKLAEVAPVTPSLLNAQIEVTAKVSSANDKKAIKTLKPFRGVDGRTKAVLGKQKAERAALVTSKRA